MCRPRQLLKICKLITPHPISILEHNNALPNWLQGNCSKMETYGSN